MYISDFFFSFLWPLIFFSSKIKKKMRAPTLGKELLSNSQWKVNVKADVTS